MYQPDFPPVPFRLGLYPVVDSVAWIERLLEAGVRTLQLRIKDRRDSEVEDDVIAAIALGRRYHARLFINDYWRLAIKHQAYGVHLGQEDLETTDLSAIRKAGLRLGVSTHDDMEIDIALAARPLTSLWVTSSRRKPNRCPPRRRDSSSLPDISNAWRITPPWRSAELALKRPRRCWRPASAASLWSAPSPRRRTGGQRPTSCWRWQERAMNDHDFMRYSRQLLLEDIAIEGQQKLLASRVLIIGLGGLGSPAALYLAGAGVGTLTLADDDAVHLSNLQRQILFTSADIDRPKAAAAKTRLSQLNPQITLVALQQRLSGEALRAEVAKADVVLDCTDNMVTRQAINAACVALDIPLVTASAVGFGGQLMVLTPPWTQGCYRCLWPDSDEPQRNCRTAGIVGPVVGMMGTLQALEAIKLLSGMTTPRNTLRLFDARTSSWRNLALQRSRGCPVCGGRHADLV